MQFSATEHPRLEALEKALDILSCFNLENREWGVSQLSSHLGLHKSRVHRALSVLEQRGFLRKNLANSRYRLGLKIFELGATAAKDIDLRTEARFILLELSKKTNCTVLLRVLDGLEMVVVEAVESLNPLRYVQSVGSRQSLTYGATGKLILALLAEEELAKFLDQTDLTRYTERTVCDKARLKRELKRVRKQGYAFSDEEAVKGVRAVAAPVKNEQGELLAVVSAGLPKGEFPGSHIPVLAKEVMDAAEQLAAHLRLVKGRAMDISAWLGEERKR